MYKNKKISKINRNTIASKTNKNEKIGGTDK